MKRFYRAEETRELYDLLFAGIDAEKPRIRPSGDFTADEINDVLHRILLDNPDLVHFEGEWSLRGSIRPVYTLSSRERRQAYTAAADILHAAVSSHSTSPRKKALDIYNWLAENVAYANTSHSQSAYGALVEHRAVCKGIAKAYQLLLRAANIPCILVEGTLDGAAKHVRVMMQLDGEWVHSDVTLATDAFRGRFGGGSQFFEMNAADIKKLHTVYDGDKLPAAKTAPAHKEERARRDFFFKTSRSTRQTSDEAAPPVLPERLRARFSNLQVEAVGSTCTVYRGQCGGRQKIIKYIPCGEDINKMYHAMQECSLMKLAEHCPAAIQLEEHHTVRTADGFAVLLVEEYLPTLEKHCRENAPTPADAVKIAHQLCTALMQLRRAGIAHLDIQPSNIFAASDGKKLKFGDFGSALAIEDVPALEKRGELRGTPAYIAPEVYRSRKYSEAADVYSIGIILYCLLDGGRLPFSRECTDSADAVTVRLSGGKVTLPDIAGVSPELRKCVERACAFSPEERFASLGRFAAELAAMLPESTVPAAPFIPVPPKMSAMTIPPAMSAPNQGLFGPSKKSKSVPPAPPVFVVPPAPPSEAPAPAPGFSIPAPVFSADEIAYSVALMPADVAATVSPAAPVPPAASSVPAPQPEAVSLSEVQFSAVAPRAAHRGEYTELQILMYEQEFRSVVEEALAMVDGEAQEKRSGFFKVADSTRVKVVLTSPDIAIDDDSEEQLWAGKYLSFDFAFEVPEDYAKRQILLKANVYFNDTPATRLLITLKLGDGGKPELTRADIRAAFVSYASQDLPRVGTIVQGMQKARPDMDIFLDVYSLHSGEDWQQTLFRRIDLCDTLFLCWSKNARASEWVEKEWRYALQHKGIDAIEPIPIDPPNVCPPPEELSAKHFNDTLLFIINR